MQYKTPQLQLVPNEANYSTVAVARAAVTNRAAGEYGRGGGGSLDP